MKFLLFFFVAALSWAVAPAKNLPGIDSSLRLYLQSVENGMKGDSAYRSYGNIELSTATYNATTTTVNFPVQIVDGNNTRMFWFNDVVSTFSVSSSIAVTHGKATISSGSATFNAGSAGVTLSVTGSSWAIGDYITVTLPAISAGCLSAATATQILTFVE